MDIPKETNDIATKLLDAAFIVHRELGPGLLESVYESCLFDLLIEMGIATEKQKIIPVNFRGKLLETGFRSDLVIEEKILVEIKAVEKLTPLHEAQIMTYLKLTPYKVGYLLNFNSQLLKHGIRRFVMDDKSPAVTAARAAVND